MPVISGTVGTEREQRYFLPYRQGNIETEPLKEVEWPGFSTRESFSERLSRMSGKLSSTVLRGEWSCEAPDPPDCL